MHTDIREILLEKFPEKIRPWLEQARPYILLARLDRPIGVWLLLLPGWWAIALAAGGGRLMTAHDWWIFFLFGIGAVVMRAAGCVINDLWDRDLDKKVERTKLRPLASGAITEKEAIIFLAELLIVGLIILLEMNTVTIVLGCLSLPLIVAYPYMKRLTWWPQAFLGLTFNFGALMGWSAVTGKIQIPALLIYGAGILWTLAYDTVYAQQDIEDDALAGMKSTALLLGEDIRKAVSSFLISAWIWITAAGAIGATHEIAFALMMIPALAQAGWQIAAWNADNKESSLKVFKSNRDFGLLVLAAFLLS